MRLNLGAGEDRREGWVNVDLRPEVADVVADVRALPYEPETANEIVAHDILEHLPPCDTLAALKHWYEILEPGGHLEVKVPNLYQLCRIIAALYQDARHAQLDVYVANLYGGHRWGPEGSYDRHEWGWTPVGLHHLLRDAGFEIESFDESLNQTVVARKPEGP
jgi:SAM-dependent methyltransferase